MSGWAGHGTFSNNTSQASNNLFKAPVMTSLRTIILKGQPYMIGFLCCLVLRESDNKVNLSTTTLPRKACLDAYRAHGKHQADPIENKDIATA
jgi:hypothetical protein